MRTVRFSWQRGTLTSMLTNVVRDTFMFLASIAFIGLLVVEMMAQ